MSARADLSATDLLRSQHEETALLFDQLAAAETLVRKQLCFEALGDALATHTAIEERHFYPAVRAQRTEEILLESLEEHLGIKRVLTDLLATPVGSDTFDPKVKVLRDLVEHHVGEEENDLFPKVERLFDEATLESLARQMIATNDLLVRNGDPRWAIPRETIHAPELVSLR